MILEKLKKLQHYRSVLGWKGAFRFVLGKLTGTQPLSKVHLPGLKYPVFIRIGSTDLSVLKQVMVERHYDFPCDLQPKVIVDAGANIGLSAVYFATKYPSATVIAVEPETSNYEVLKRNAAPYSRIKPMKVALWKENKIIKLFDPGSGHHGFRIEEGSANLNQNMVEGKTVDALMTEMTLPKIDILKLDIEGAEREVLQDATRWIDRVEFIMAELHDDLKPGCREMFDKATRDFPREFANGETIARSRSPQTVAAAA